MKSTLLLLLVFAPSMSVAEEAKPRVAYRHSVVLKVGNRDQAADSVIAAAEKLDGYFIDRTDGMVRLKVPADSVKRLLAEVEPLGVVLERQQQAQDLGDVMDERRTRLSSKQEVLQRYFAVLAVAGPSAVVEVEQEMTNLVGEIESLKGSLQMYEHELRFAEVEVSFQFRERRPPVKDGSSSFRWLNSMNLADLISEFSHD
jgi:hypothetical protein